MVPADVGKETLKRHEALSPRKPRTTGSPRRWGEGRSSPEPSGGQDLLTPRWDGGPLASRRGDNTFLSLIFLNFYEMLILLHPMHSQPVNTLNVDHFYQLQHYLNKPKHSRPSKRHRTLRIPSSFMQFCKPILKTATTLALK